MTGKSNLAETGVPNVPLTIDQGDPAEQTPGWRVLGAYKQMLAYLFTATLIVIAAILLTIIPYFILYLSNKTNADTSSVFAVVVLAGSLGALFSAMLRLYNFDDLPKALIAKELEGLPGVYLLIYSLVPMVIGAIAAAILYVVFAGKLITSNLMPEFSCHTTDPNGCGTFISFVTYWSPKSAEDFAKVLVWGFIAGFAERLVPDTLQALSTSVPSKFPQSEGSNNHTKNP